ncbi:polyprenyl synthetase family protein [Lactococcus termiticola]|uniref:Geranylgeranyl pyrophosphate synthase n=1 Tax=Lactococcus termiticola TaxID=2169526 RepID=A0A2R5HEU2_9LACT|nr:polyprenyl synthetase family protein [Lactococcus termiticola]GBG96573.1 geranylgeranyl pyrophosphate synthase [Lactococcus termiticola]
MHNYWQDYPELQEKLEKVQALMRTRLDISSPDVKAAVDSFVSNGGKMIRPALFFFFADLVTQGQNKDEEKMLKIAASLEILHSATLVHDDIIDDSPLRRGLPSIEAQFGKDTAVYTGDFLYTVFFELLVESMAETKMLAQNAQAMKKILQGELNQMASSFDSKVSIRRYLKVISGKTAELLKLACLQGVFFAGGDFELQRASKKVGLAIGLAFQIYDDVLNFTPNLEEENKPVLTDFRQGIFTLPVLIARENNPEALAPYFEAPEQLTQAEAMALADLVKAEGGIDESLGLAQLLTDKALEEIGKFPDSEKKDELIKAVKALLERNY